MYYICWMTNIRSVLDFHWTTDIHILCQLHPLGLYEKPWQQAEFFPFFISTASSSGNPTSSLQNILKKQATPYLYCYYVGLSQDHLSVGLLQQTPMQSLLASFLVGVIVYAQYTLKWKADYCYSDYQNTSLHSHLTITKLPASKMAYKNLPTRSPIISLSLPSLFNFCPFCPAILTTLLLHSCQANSSLRTFAFCCSPSWGCSYAI